jgi:hypothetical protein
MALKNWKRKRKCFSFLTGFGPPASRQPCSPRLLLLGPLGLPSLWPARAAQAVAFLPAPLRVTGWAQLMAQLAPRFPFPSLSSWQSGPRCQDHLPPHAAPDFFPCFYRSNPPPNLLPSLFWAPSGYISRMPCSAASISSSCSCCGARELGHREREP